MLGVGRRWFNKMRTREGMETEIENHVKWLDGRTYKLKWYEIKDYRFWKSK